VRKTVTRLRRSFGGQAGTSEASETSGDVPFRLERLEFALQTPPAGFLPPVPSERLSSLPCKLPRQLRCRPVTAFRNGFLAPPHLTEVLPAKFKSRKLILARNALPFHGLRRLANPLTGQ